LRNQLRLMGKKSKTFGNREGAGKPLAPWCETRNWSQYRPSSQGSRECPTFHFNVDL